VRSGSNHLFPYWASGSRARHAPDYASDRQEIVDVHSGEQTVLALPLALDFWIVHCINALEAPGGEEGPAPAPHPPGRAGLPSYLGRTALQTVPRTVRAHAEMSYDDPARFGSCRKGTGRRRSGYTARKRESLVQDYFR
jgi:hypothetical protein